MMISEVFSGARIGAAWLACIKYSWSSSLKGLLGMMSVSPQINVNGTGTQKGLLPTGIIIFAVSFSTSTDAAPISLCHSLI